MRVFISWSGARSKAVAAALTEWLPGCVQRVQPFMSKDIDAGRAWSKEIADALAESKVGIIVVTPDNHDKPWLHFEAGALAKTLWVDDNTRVIPYLVGLEPHDIPKGPLNTFQAKKADRDGT